MCDAAVCDVEIVDVGYLLVILDVEDIYVVECVGNDLASAAIILEKEIFLLDGFGAVTVSVAIACIFGLFIIENSVCILEKVIL